jgi:hypothetical protein
MIGFCSDRSHLRFMDSRTRQPEKSCGIAGPEFAGIRFDSMAIGSASPHHHGGRCGLECEWNLKTRSRMQGSLPRQATRARTSVFIAASR